MSLEWNKMYVLFWDFISFCNFPVPDTEDSAELEPLFMQEPDLQNSVDYFTGRSLQKNLGARVCVETNFPGVFRCHRWVSIPVRFIAICCNIPQVNIYMYLALKQVRSQNAIVFSCRNLRFTRIFIPLVILCVLTVMPAIVKTCAIVMFFKFIPCDTDERSFEA